MSPVLSAVIVLSALGATVVLLAHWLVPAGRRAAPRSGFPRQAPAPRRLPARRPEEPPPPPPQLSPDGYWLWNGSDWVPAWWASAPVPATPPRPTRSQGCASEAGVGCLVLVSVAVGVVALVVLGAVALALARAAGL